MPRSALYRGRVRHRRLRSPEHRFSYPVWYLLADLDELGELDQRLRFFSHNRFNLTSFDDRDHMGPTAEPVRDKLLRWLRDRGVETAVGRVRLLTQLRILGHVFNPVSFYFVDDLDGRLCHAVAEVNNTFGESYCYLLEVAESSVRHEQRKRFHVSPFQPVDGRYRFRITDPEERMSVHIDLLREGGRVFDSTLSLTRRELDGASLLTTVARHPHIGFWTLALIHYQALRLWLKKAPFFPKPEAPQGAWRTRHGRS
jgi:DUF1365 family protein